MKRIPIEEATEAQLRQFAVDTLGIAIKQTAKPETVLARVKAAWDKPEIVLEGHEPETQQNGSGTVPELITDSAPEPITEKQQPPEPGKVRLIVAVTEEAGGNDPVQVGVNGKVMLIPRGKPVDIPLAYFQVLENAITYKYDPLPDGGISPEPRKVRLYPYQLLEQAAA